MANITPPKPGTMLNPNRPVTDEYYQLMLQMADLGVEEKDIDRQYGIAEELRQTEDAPMRGNSRVQVAASPLEQLGATARKAYGQYEYGNALDRDRKLADLIRNRTMKTPKLDEIPDYSGAQYSGILGSI